MPEIVTDPAVSGTTFVSEAARSIADHYPLSAGVAAPLVVDGSPWIFAALSVASDMVFDDAQAVPIERFDDGAVILSRPIVRSSRRLGEIGAEKRGRTASWTTRRPSMLD
ncbi:hypothetical protein GCM10010464_74650 [Pseudonocardia yunnanensis]|uniref:Uncharacterized protein n=1 Tax=Pseudonocardia yunnanensis TaxID=58107 RepID=A0ABW4F8L6_9PSEU